MESTGVDSKQHNDVANTKPLGSGWQITTTVLLSLGSSILRTSYEISLPSSLLIVGSVVYFVSYWIPPRPKMSFWKFALAIEYFLAGGVSAIWYVPNSLAHKIPFWIACGLPVFAHLILSYWVFRWLHGNERPIGSMGKWLLGSFIATIVIVFFRLI